MSVQSVQLHGLEQVVPPVRSAGLAGTASQSGATGNSRGSAQPTDQVIVSDQARQLAAGSGASGEVELKLDFRKLRELATPEHAASDPSGSA